MKYSISRRKVLKGAAALGLASQGSVFALQGAARATESATQSLVLIYLRGGADFLNMIVPRNDSSYQMSRPGIGIPDDALLALDRDFGLHPALGDLQPLYEQKLFAPIVCVGSPNETRSHFDAQDFMNYAAPGSRTVHNGWLNRYLTATTQLDGKGSNEFRGIGMQRLLPTALRGDFPVLAVPDGFDSARANNVLDRFEKFYGAGDKLRKTAGEESESDGEQAMDKREEPASGLDLVGSGKVTIETLRRFREIVTKTERTDHGYPNNYIGKGLQRIAQVLLSDEGLEVAAIDYGGWDHHAGQGAEQGAQANLMRNLSRALAAFRRHLGPAFERTVVMVMTEFGRTVRENGSAGTDHGHGSGMFLLGGGLKGGKVHGDWNGLRSAKLYQGRDLPVTTDFRDVMASVLREHMDFKAPRDFFPGYKPKKLKLFR